MELKQSEVATRPTGSGTAISRTDSEVRWSSGSLILDFLHRRRPLFLLIAPVLMLIFGRPEFSPYSIGLALVLVGQIVRIWSAGHISKNRQLATFGPFAYVRNPLYLGSLLIIIGYSAMTNRIEVWAPIILVFGIMHWGAIIWEERYLSGKFGETFEDYRGSVPRLIPRLTPAFKVRGFSLRQVWINREQVSALSTLGIIIVFALKLWWGK